MPSVMSTAHHVYNLDSEKSALRDPTICPLNNPRENNFLPLDNNLLKLEGCYLFCDEKGKTNFRSGNASRIAGDSFKKRLEDHEKGALLKTKECRDVLFYLSCPSEKMGSKGKCQWLNPYCAFGLDSRDQSAINVLKDETFFDYESAKSRIKTSNLRDENEIVAKKHLFHVHLNAVTMLFYQRITTHLKILDVRNLSSNVENVKIGM